MVSSVVVSVSVVLSSSTRLRQEGQVELWASQRPMLQEGGKHDREESSEKGEERGGKRGKGGAREGKEEGREGGREGRGKRGRGGNSSERLRYCCLGKTRPQQCPGKKKLSQCLVKTRLQYCLSV